MEATRCGIGAATKLSTSMESGHHQLNAGETSLCFDINGNAAAIISDLNGTIDAKGHHDLVTITGERLINRVIDDLP
jgi:hypothetical protein